MPLYKLTQTGSEVQTLLNKANGIIFDSTPTANSTNGVQSGGVKTYVDNKFNGASKAISYSTYQAFITAFNAINDSAEYHVGQDIYIVTSGVPDLWISTVESSKVTYSYVDDATFISDLTTNGYVQVGFYKVSALETQSVDLNNYIDLSARTQDFVSTKTLRIAQGQYFKISNKSNSSIYSHFELGSSSSILKLAEGSLWYTTLNSRGVFRVDQGSTPYDVALPCKANGTLALTSDIDIKFNNTNVTDAYSDQATYSVGDLVIYNNILYKCTTAVTTAEVFDSTKWTVVTIASLLNKAVTIDGGTQEISSTKTLTFGQYYSLKIADKTYPTTRVITLEPGSNAVISVQHDSNNYVNLNSEGNIRFRKNEATERTIQIPRASGTFALLQNIAPNFSTSTSYVVGDLVVYNSKLYRCTTAHTGSWNSGNFTEIIIDDILDEKVNIANMTIDKGLVNVANAGGIQNIAANDSYTFNLTGAASYYSNNTLDYILVAYPSSENSLINVEQKFDYNSDRTFIDSENSISMTWDSTNKTMLIENTNSSNAKLVMCAAMIKEPTYVKSVSNLNKVYGTDDTGLNKDISYGSSDNYNTIMSRDADGRSMVSTPIKPASDTSNDKSIVNIDYLLNQFIDFTKSNSFTGITSPKSNEATWLLKFGQIKICGGRVNVSSDTGNATAALTYGGNNVFSSCILFAGSSNDWTDKTSGDWGTVDFANSTLSSLKLASGEKGSIWFCIGI